MIHHHDSSSSSLMLKISKWLGQRVVPVLGNFPKDMRNALLTIVVMGDAKKVRTIRDTSETELLDRPPQSCVV
jgi:hypothetical protein